MDEKQLQGFSWAVFFIITSLCFFTFSVVLEFLNHTYPRFFIWVGSISFLLGLLNATFILLSRALSKGKHKLFP